MKKNNQQTSRWLVSLVAGLVLIGLEAGQLTWTGGGDGTSWSDAANWDATPDWSVANDLDFSAVAGGTTLYNDAATTFGAVTFGADKGTITWTADKPVQPQSGTITIPAGTTLDAQFKVGNWVGWDGWNLTVAGGGTLWIDAFWAGTYVGGQLTLDGVTAVMKVGLSGNGAGALVMKGGARLTVEENFNFHSLTSESASDVLELGGKSMTLKQAQGTFAGALSGFGVVLVKGSRTWTLSGNSPDFTGRIEMYESQVDVTGALGPKAQIVSVRAGTLNVNADQTIVGVSGTAAEGGISIADGKTLTVTGGGDYGARLSGAGTFALDADGQTLTLSGANTLAGTVRVKAGTLVAADTAGTALSGYPEGLVSRYSFDGDLTTDDLGANDLKVSAGTPVLVEGGLGGSRCVRFDGASKMQTVANTFIKEQTPFTVSFWIRTTSTDSWTNNGTFIELGLWTNDRNRDVAFGACNSGDYSPNAITTLQGGWVWQGTWQNGTWRNYALTFDGTNLVLYTNGSTSKSESKTWDIVNTEMVIGKKVTADYDEMLVFSRALSADEVKTLYGTPFPVPTGDATADPAPVAHWAFDDAENPGKDTSGNGYDLTVEGGTLGLDESLRGYGKAARFYDGSAYLKLAGSGLPAKFPSGGASFTVNVRLAGWNSSNGADLFSMGDVTTAGKSFRLGSGGYPKLFGYSTSSTSGDAERTVSGLSGDIYTYMTFTFVYDAAAGTITSYCDGCLADGPRSAAPNIDAQGTVYIAYNPASDSRRISSRLDDVQVFAEALDAAQVRRLVQSLAMGCVPGALDGASLAIDDGAAFYAPASASVAGLSGAGAVAVGANGTLATASASGFTGTVYGPGALALAEGAVLRCTRETPALDMTGTLTLPTAATVCFAETGEIIAADKQGFYVVARATALAGATDLSGWTCTFDGAATAAVTFVIKDNAVLAKVSRGLALIIR